MSTYRRSGMRVPIVLFCLALGCLVAPTACDLRTEESLGVREPAPGPFVVPEASTPPEEAGLTQYCPSDQCPKGHTTCPLSRFRCDVDLLSDRDNCGACGVVCPANERGATFECVDGACVMACQTSAFFDSCDGVVDNGCETSLRTDDNCKACGRKCDPAKPCVDRGLNDVDCGCHDDQTVCADSLFGTRCVDTRTNDSNCGVCGKVCDPTEGGSPSYTNTYYGCVESDCGGLKCTPNTADCDGNLRSNGCETSLVTSENCGACGATCAPGQECRLNEFMFPQCMCPAGQTFCSDGEIDGVAFGKCHDLRTDNQACGVCEKACKFRVPNGREACVYGDCKQRCFDGWDDCNDNTSDGCETNTGSDPRNCGVCGNVCDAISGQACVGGRCVVEPCGEIDGGGPTR